MKTKIMFIAICCFLMQVHGCSSDNEKSENIEIIQTENIIQFESETIDDFYEELFVKILADEPEYIDDLGDLSKYGVSFQKDKLTDSSESYYLKRETLLKSALEKLMMFEVGSAHSDFMNKENVKWFLEIELDNIKYRNNNFFLSHIIGEHQSLYNLLVQVHTIESKTDVENLIERFRASETKLVQMRERYIELYNDGYVMDSKTIAITKQQLTGMYKTRISSMDIY